MSTAYYARFMGIYGSPAEAEAIESIEAAGFRVLEFPTQAELDKCATGAERMGLFQPVVEQADALFYSTVKVPHEVLDAPGFTVITAGVAKEIAWAKAADIPVFEVPDRRPDRITINVEDTRKLLRYTKEGS